MNNRYHISKYIVAVLLAFLSITFSCTLVSAPIASATVGTSFKLQKFEQETIREHNENSVFYRSTETKGKIRVKYQASYCFCDLGRDAEQTKHFVATLSRKFLHPDSFIYNRDHSASYLRGPPAITA